MKRFYLSLLSVSIMAMMPVIAGAAGTYYNGNLYQNPQRYGNNGGGYYNSYGAGRGYNQGMQTMGTQKQSAQKKQKSAKNNTEKQGFHLGIFASHEFANWDFEMKQAGSRLRYDNVAWNVISGDAAYYFGSAMPVVVKLGARYGKQFGETSMIDDDISNGAYGYVDYDPGRVSGYAMSVGTSDGGTQMGFNAALGLTDFFKLGNMKITPSVGYRYLKYELTTKRNSGLTMDVFMGNSSHLLTNCIEVGGEMQCDPYVGFLVGDQIQVSGRDTNPDGSLTDIIVPSGASYLTLGDTYYYTQSGTSHKYETVWQGPYIALDMEYAINNNNFVNAGIEFGLPMYTSTGDQPYRVDWEHPKSVEDKGGFGDAYHLGLNASWSTAITDSVMFSLGMTYDYYKVNNADATTYINRSLYTNQVTDLTNYIAYLTNQGADANLIAAYQKELDKAQDEVDFYSARGWKLESKDEIKSIYKSMGIRAGISIKF